MIGGAATPAVGLGFGDVVVVEVLKELLGETAAEEKCGVTIGYMFPEQRDAATRLARSLRENGEKVELSLSKQKPKQFFSRAGAGSAAEAIFIGPDDLAKGTAKRKNLVTRQEPISH
jgi:histidyl-tRNA synthetase